MRMLYLAPGPTPPPKDPKKNMFRHLSQYFSGDILAPIWGKKNERSRAAVKEINDASGNFQYHTTFSSTFPKPLKLFWDLNFYLLKGFYLHFFKKKYDVIVTYGPFKTGLAGYMLKKITGAKLIVVVPGNPQKSFLFETETPSLLDVLRSRISDKLIPFVINRADCVKLLYPNQLDGYERIRKNHITIFHNFVPVSILKSSGMASEKYILFLGFPWFLKGVDILIKAFNLVSHEIPDYSLKIVGFCPDKTYFEKLAGTNKKIELCNPVFYEEAMKLLDRCALLVLPSRTEAMGRVLLEAMAFKKPIIASNVDGIPHYIKNDFNGLLFEAENVNDLAEKMIKILNNSDYAAALAKNGLDFVHAHLSEERFVECFKEMVEEVLEYSGRK